MRRRRYFTSTTPVKCKDTTVIVTGYSTWQKRQQACARDDSGDKRISSGGCIGVERATNSITIPKAMAKQWSGVQRHGNRGGAGKYYYRLAGEGTWKMDPYQKIWPQETRQTS
eukprot:gene9154-biopygen16707